MRIKHEIYDFQAKHIKDTLMLVCTGLGSKSKLTSFDKDIMQSIAMIDNVIADKIDEPTPRL